MMSCWEFDLIGLCKFHYENSHNNWNWQHFSINQEFVRLIARFFIAKVTSNVAISSFYFTASVHSSWSNGTTTSIDVKFSIRQIPIWSFEKIFYPEISMNFNTWNNCFNANIFDTSRLSFFGVVDWVRADLKLIEFECLTF